MSERTENSADRLASQRAAVGAVVVMAVRGAPRIMASAYQH
jgi:hypothetical protein